MDLTAPNAYVETHSVAEWRQRRLPETNKRPAIFLIG